MEQKIFRAPIVLKADDEGTFKSVFATLNVVDFDGDVTVPGAFRDGQEVVVEGWNHDYGLPPGKGMIHTNEREAWIDGRFFLDTQPGRENYLTLKNLGGLEEWSYTFSIDEWSAGKFGDREVRFLRGLDVWGVAPVTRGAGIDTHTVALKGLKPYANEHACRLRNPGDFEEDSFRRISREHEGRRYDVIMGRLEGETTLIEQAYRYPIKIWDVDEARAHCRDHDGRFEAAKEKTGADNDEGQGGPHPQGKREGEGSVEPSGAVPGIVKIQIEIFELED